METLSTLPWIIEHGGAAYAKLGTEQSRGTRLFTVSGHVAETADWHETLLAWTGLLSRARLGHVVVCQPHTRAVALMGELSAAPD